MPNPLLALEWPIHVHTDLPNQLMQYVNKEMAAALGLGVMKSLGRLCADQREIESKRAITRSDPKANVKNWRGDIEFCHCQNWSDR